MERIAESVKKTGKVLVVHEDSLSWGIGSEIAARVADELFPWLDGPVRRVASKDTWVAYAPRLEEVILPQTPDVLQGHRGPRGVLRAASQEAGPPDAPTIEGVHADPARISMTKGTPTRSGRKKTPPDRPRPLGRARREVLAQGSRVSCDSRCSRRSRCWGRACSWRASPALLRAFVAAAARASSLDGVALDQPPGSAVRSRLALEPAGPHAPLAAGAGAHRVFVWWGLHVRLVVAYVPLILAQVVFAYGVAALLDWSRRGRHGSASGPCPSSGAPTSSSGSGPSGSTGSSP